MAGWSSWDLRNNQITLAWRILEAPLYVTYDSWMWLWVWYSPRRALVKPSLSRRPRCLTQRRHVFRTWRFIIGTRGREHWFKSL
jgi:hypothetical protein